MQRSHVAIVTLRAHVPAAETFGLNNEVNMVVGEAGRMQVAVIHWEMMDGSVQDTEGPLSELIKTVRVRKGLASAIPALDVYCDIL